MVFIPPNAIPQTIDQTIDQSLPVITQTKEDELDLIEVCSLEASEYIIKEGRIAHLFKPERIYNWIQNEIVDPQTGEPIRTIAQACDYAVFLSQQYADEDFELKMEKKRLDNNRRQQEFKERNRNPEVIALHTKWREAVRQRNEIVKQWDVYVAQCKLEYNVVKAKGVK